MTNNGFRCSLKSLKGIEKHRYIIHTYLEAEGTVQKQFPSFAICYYANVNNSLTKQCVYYGICCIRTIVFLKTNTVQILG